MCEHSLRENTEFDANAASSQAEPKVASSANVSQKSMKSSSYFNTPTAGCAFTPPSSASTSKRTNLRQLDPLNVPEAVGLVRPSWLPYANPARGRSSRPRKQTRDDWSSRHHVCESKDNRNLSRHQRIYFDDIPQTNFYAGKYQMVPGHRSRNFDQFCLAPIDGQLRELQRRFERYPFREAAHLSQTWPLSSSAKQRSPHLLQGGVVDSFQDSMVQPCSNNPQATIQTGASDHGDSPTSSCRGESPGRLTPPQREPHRRGTQDEDVPRLQRKASSSSQNRNSTGSYVSRKGSSCSLGASEKHKSTNKLQQFQTWCLSKFGGLIKLWRLLDLHGNMRIGQAQFLKGLRDCGYPGDPREIFKLLNIDGTNTLLFYHFAPEAALALAKLMRWTREHHGGLKGLGFMTEIDQHATISSKTFLNVFNKKGFVDQDAILCAFDLMDKDGSGSIDRMEAVLLDKWDMPEWLAAEPDDVAADAIRFKILEKNGGNGLRAWRSINQAHIHRMSWQTFRQACHKTLTAEDLQKLPCAWRSLDADLSGWLTLREFFPECYEVLTTMCNYAVEQSSSVLGVFLNNETGKDEKWTPKEFRYCCRPSGLTDEQISSLFTGLNLDDDGSISMNELRFLETWQLVAGMKVDK